MALFVYSITSTVMLTGVHSVQSEVNEMFTLLCVYAAQTRCNPSVLLIRSDFIFHIFYFTEAIYPLPSPLPSPLSISSLLTAVHFLPTMELSFVISIIFTTSSIFLSLLNNPYLLQHIIVMTYLLVLTQFYNWYNT